MYDLGLDRPRNTVDRIAKGRGDLKFPAWIRRNALQFIRLYFQESRSIPSAHTIDAITSGQVVMRHRHGRKMSARGRLTRDGRSAWRLLRRPSRRAGRDWEGGTGGLQAGCRGVRDGSGPTDRTVDAALRSYPWATAPGVMNESGIRQRLAGLSRPISMFHCRGRVLQ